MNKKVLKIVIIILAIFAFFYFKIPTFGVIMTPPPEPELKAHFIDVGQGDSCFIELPNDETLLIDSGESKYANDVMTFYTQGDTAPYGRFTYIFSQIDKGGR